MTQDEMRRLLGGYATDTLSERERSALFQAAIEDQDLFDALQNEDALRELLADAATRQELKAELRPKRRGRTWLVAAAGAAAAVIAIAVVYWPRPAARKAQPVQIASVQAPKESVAPKLAPPASPQPVIPKRVPGEARRQAAPPAPAAQARLGGFAGAIGGYPPTAAPRALAALAPQSNVAASGPLYAGPLVRYSVLRSGSQGNQIRIGVVSQVDGDLALYRANAAGAWQRIYPTNAPAIPIAANRPYEIPDVGMTVQAPRNKLRLVIEPRAPRFGAQLADSFVDQRPRALAAAKPASPPLVVEIPIGPN